MPNKHLGPSTTPSPTTPYSQEHPQRGLQPLEQDQLRLLSRSPHPYHRQNFELLDPKDQYNTLRPSLVRSTIPLTTRESTPTSDSGTEADDEHFLRGLPAPKRFHKGLRGRNEIISGTSTPIPSPSFLEEEEDRRLSHNARKETCAPRRARGTTEKLRRRKEIIRRTTELAIIIGLGVLVATNNQVQPIWCKWERELCAAAGVCAGLVILYPLRLVLWARRHGNLSTGVPLRLPATFDPAPLFYAPSITIYVASLIAVDNEAVLLPNIVLAICSLPPALVPSVGFSCAEGSALHWALSCVPLFLNEACSTSKRFLPCVGGAGNSAAVSVESASLLYPLHHNLLLILHTLTTTSLLTTELQLLSISLLDLLFLSSSPQMVILKSMLWIGGLDILVSCSHAITWGISLARVPKWRFRRSLGPSKSKQTFLSSLVSLRRVRHDLFHAPLDGSSCSSCEAMDEHEESDDSGIKAGHLPMRVKTITFGGADATGVSNAHPRSPGGDTDDKDGKIGSAPQRRHTLPGSGKPMHGTSSHTPSGRKKRSASASIRAFFSLTQEQATARKWMYAVFVYVCILGSVFVPLPVIGVKKMVMTEALHGYEPVGWALGYLFGNVLRFRWEVVSHNLERWICLPARVGEQLVDAHMGWVEYLRQYHFGEANTRLLISAYCLAVIAIGLVVVFRLSPIYEVDTRRKVFHFMMVAMFLPTTYIDPTFAGLALSIILSLFLILDLLRASQLPPLSRPLASFLAPYVDGRDLRGPVVISHIFLLIGCAIPLWLSLGSLPRAGNGYLEGWAVPTREVSMVSGVVCVGLGDAAASLIGRRYGHRKWLWGGGKSLEGSVAFAAAVFAGLMGSSIWLWAGGWASTNEKTNSWMATIQEMGTCASLASLTEAVLTGGNDNVVVPVVLWTCVKSLGV
ncbi:hypothetical protein F4778DRAFT_714186 [Xylariomycetidae sp. FL2044]|nr:hypothetical protein F4778DRAFT_714186 [Xylariomycetidae sp. FL2044]